MGRCCTEAFKIDDQQDKGLQLVAVAMPFNLMEMVIAEQIVIIHGIGPGIVARLTPFTLMNLVAPSPGVSFRRK